jgi:hypothetical protein
MSFRPDQQGKRMSTVHQLSMESEGETPEAVVARIQARGAGTLPPPPSPEVLATIAARVAHEQPLDAEEEAAWNRAWAAIEDEMRARTSANAIAEGHR